MAHERRAIEKVFYPALCLALIALVLAFVCLWLNAGRRPVVEPGRAIENPSVHQLVEMLKKARQQDNVTEAMRPVYAAIRSRVDKHDAERMEPVVDELKKLLVGDWGERQRWAALCLKELGPAARDSVAALVQALNATRADFEANHPCHVGIAPQVPLIVALDAIAPDWCARTDVSEAVRSRYCDMEAGASVFAHDR